MLKLKKVVAIVVILLILLGMSVTVKASSNTLINLNNYIGTGTTNGNTVDDPDDEESNIVLNTTTNTTGGAVVQPQTNSSESENSLPQTGVTEDITVMFFIVVCVVSAIYAYKKIRDYRS